MNKLVWALAFDPSQPGHGVGAWGGLFTLAEAPNSMLGESSMTFFTLRSMSGVSFVVDYRTGFIIGRNPHEIASKIEKKNPTEDFCKLYRAALDEIHKQHRESITILHRSAFWDVLEAKG